MLEFLKAQYLDYVNNYISIIGFAESKGISHELAQSIIIEGRIVHTLSADGLDGLSPTELEYFNTNILK